MKRILGALVALLLLLCVAPGVLGRFAEARINRGLDALDAKAPYLQIAERHWTQGWFRSHQEVVWEFVAPQMPPPPEGAPATGAEAEAPASEAPAAQAGEAPAEPAPAPATPAESLRFTVRNEVLHGPVLWTSGLGLARMDTRLVLSDAWREKVVKFFGTDEPWRISTRVAFFGGGTTTISGDKRTIDVAKIDSRQEGSLSWDDFRLSMSLSRKAKSFDIDGRQPRIEFKNAQGVQVVMSGITVEGEGERIVGDLYESDVTLAAAKLAVSGVKGQNFEVAELLYEQDGDHSGDFMDYATRAGTGSIDSPQLRELKLAMKETHFDMSFRHLHIPTLEKLIAAINQSATTQPQDMQAAQQQVLGPLVEHGMELLRHEPELVLDRIGFATGAGAGWIKGSIKLTGLPAEDASLSLPALMQGLQVDIRIEADQAMLEGFPNGATLLGLAVDQGMATRDGKKLVSRIEYKNGQLTINGKSQQLPGFGPRVAPPAPEGAQPGA